MNSEKEEKIVGYFQGETGYFLITNKGDWFQVDKEKFIYWKNLLG
jgi:hypothetical protein